jgi:MFS family permease
MTGIDDAGWARPLRPYREIFSVPGAWRFSAAGVIGRMPMSMFGLGTVLLISASTGKYGIAGAVSATGSLGFAFSSPRLARLIDRVGQRRVLLPLVSVFVAAAVALILAVELHGPTWAYFIPGALAGAAMPALGTMVRARWSVLLAGSSKLHAAFSFESVADELCFIIGPAAVTLLATEVYPAAGVGVAAVLCLAGTLWFTAQRATEPAVAQPGQRGLADAPQGSIEGGLERSRPPRSRRGLGGILPPRRQSAAPGLVVLTPVYVFLGAMFVSVDLSTVDFAQRSGHKPLAGLILGVYAFGSATGGLWYGSRHWRSPLANRFALTLCLTAIGVCTFWAMPDLLALTCVIYLCGLAIAPTLITGFSLLEAQASPKRRTEAMSWLSSGIGVGVAGGSSVVGFIIDAHGDRWGYLFAAACGLTSAIICLAGRRRLQCG